MPNKSRDRRPPGEAPAPGIASPPGSRPVEPSEDFAERRDIETADEPTGEHDRRHHDRAGADVESTKPV
jgi:hypothetical protein